jgi:Type I restriction modification DNA specificity domain
MSAWQARTIGEVCTKVVSGGTPLTSKTEYYQNGTIPWLKTKEINQRRIYSTENFITELGVKNSSAKIVPINTVTVAMYGDGQTAGRVGLIKTPMTTNQACCNLIINEDLADPEFVFYLLRGSYEELVAKKTGSGQQNLSAQLIKSFEFSAPPVIEQKAIANILSSLDDKIDLLERQNKTIEALAEILFRQWFVEDAQEGWEDGTVEDLFVLKRGYDLPTQERIDGPYPIITSSGLGGRHTEFKVKSPGVTTGRSGLLGQVYLVQEDFWPLNTSLYIKEFKRATPIFSLLENNGFRVIQCRVSCTHA